MSATDRKTPLTLVTSLALHVAHALLVVVRCWLLRSASSGAEELFDYMVDTLMTFAEKVGWWAH